MQILIYYVTVEAPQGPKRTKTETNQPTNRKETYMKNAMSKI